MQEEPTIPAGHVILIIVGALLVAVFLNAPGLLDTAERQSGSTRSLAVGVMNPIATISNALFIDAPHQALDRLAHGAPDESVIVADDEVTSTTFPTATTTTTVPTRTITAEDPLRLLVAGDSMVGQFGPVLERTAERSGLVAGDHFFEFSTGLTRPDALDWGVKIEELRSEYGSEVIVLYLGANDAQEILIDGTWRSYDSPDGAWEAEYRSRVAALMSQLDASGAETYWMGLPVTSSDVQNARYEFFNSIYEAEAEAFDSIRFVPVWDWFTGDDGTYSEYLIDDDGSLTDMRLDDGIHYTTAGAQHLANRVFPILAGDYGIETG